MASMGKSGKRPHLAGGRRKIRKKNMSPSSWGSGLLLVPEFGVSLMSQKVMFLQAM